MSAYISSKIGSAPSSSSAEQQQQQQQQPPPPVPSHFVGGDSDEECDDDGNPNDDGEEMSCFLVAKFFTSRANNAPVEPVAVPVDLSNIPQTIGWNNLAAIPNLNVGRNYCFLAKHFFFSIPVDQQETAKSSAHGRAGIRPGRQHPCRLYSSARQVSSIYFFFWV